MNSTRGAALIALAVAAFPVVSQAQDKKAAQAKAADSALAPVSMCIGCHSIPNYHASFPQVYRVPKIGGQSKEYIEAALRAYQKGDRNQPTMRAIARELSDQQIVALAAYYSTRGR